MGGGRHRDRTPFGEEGVGIGLGVLKTGWQVLKAPGRKTFLQAGEEDPIGPVFELSVGEPLTFLLGDRECRRLIELGEQPVDHKSVRSGEPTETVIGNGV